MDFGDVVCSLGPSLTKSETDPQFRGGDFLFKSAP